MNASELMKYKNWVVVGDVLNPQKYANKILHRLEDSDYNVCGVKPSTIGENVYPSLKDTPFKPDVIDLCINPATGINIIREALEVGINKVLIQPGAESREILDFCKNNNIDAVEGCVLVELASL